MARDLLELYRRLVTWAVRAVGVYAILTGLLVVAGGSPRLSAPIYSAITTLWDPIGPTAVLLGAPLVLFGLLTLWPLLRVSQLGLVLVAVWHGYLVGSFVFAVSTQPLAGFVGLTEGVFVTCAIACLYQLRQADRLGWHP